MSEKHKTGVTAIASTSSIKAFFFLFLSDDPVQDYLVITTKEATFAFHTAIHDMSFKFSDCASKLISKFSAKKIKCETIILSARAPFSVKELNAPLQKTLFVSVTYDT